MGKSTVLNIISKTSICNVLWKACVQPPSSPAERLAIANDFEQQWNLPQKFAAHDGNTPGFNVHWKLEHYFITARNASLRWQLLLYPD